MHRLEQLLIIQTEFKDFLKLDIMSLTDEEILQWFQEHKDRTVKVIKAFEDDK